MQLQLITLTGIKLDEEVYEVSLPTSDGEIGVFPGHEPLVGVAVPGVISVRKNKTSKDSELFAISGGIIEISPEQVKVLVDEADHGDEIVEVESRSALEKAKKMRLEAKDQVDLDKAQSLIDRHEVRLRVAELRRHKRR